MGCSPDYKTKFCGSTQQLRIYSIFKTIETFIERESEFTHDGVEIHLNEIFVFFQTY